MLSLLKPLSLRQKVVVISGTDAHEARARVRDLGVAAYIQKPVNTRELYRHLFDILQDRSTNAPVISARPLSLLGYVGRFVFDDNDPAPPKRLGAVFILIALVCIFLSLLMV